MEPVSAPNSTIFEADTERLVAIGGNGGALRQALMNQKFPNDRVTWGGSVYPSQWGKESELR